MYEGLKRIYRVLVPLAIRLMVVRCRQRVKDARFLSEINAFFSANKSEAEKYAGELEYINRTKLAVVFPYRYTEKYPNYPVKAEKDAESDMLFIPHQGKRLYFPRGMQRETAISVYRSLLMEQDVQSPHRYMTEKIYRQNPEIIIDVGCAEAILALELIEQLKFAILFECDEQWIEALTATFRPWKEKVMIVNKFASNKISAKATTLDTTFNMTAPFAENFPGRILVKLDVEGAERQVLEGANYLLSRERVTFLCCTYHRQNDAKELESMFKERGLHTEFQNGYMLFRDQTLAKPFFRKGLLRAWR